jgi:hypothetical protein
MPCLRTLPTWGGAACRAWPTRQLAVSVSWAQREPTGDAAREVVAGVDRFHQLVEGGQTARRRVREVLMPGLSG